MKIIVTVALSAAVVCLVLWRRRILAGKVADMELVAFFSILFMIMMLSFPYLTDSILCVGELQGRLVEIEKLTAGAKAFGREDWIYVLPVLFRRVGFGIMQAYKLWVMLLLTLLSVSCYEGMRLCKLERPYALLGTVVYGCLFGPIRSLYTEGTPVYTLRMAYMPLAAAGLFSLFLGICAKNKEQWLLKSLVSLAGVVGLCTTFFAGNRKNLLWAALAIVLSFLFAKGIKWLQKKTEPAVFAGIVCVLVLLIAGSAIYRVNTIAHMTEAVKIVFLEYESVDLCL